MEVNRVDILLGSVLKDSGLGEFRTDVCLVAVVFYDEDGVAVLGIS